jgi:hypothetical protein
MCGLVGVVTKRSNGFSRQQQDIFGTLLFIDTFRGQDSTGVFTISNAGDVYVAKDAGMAPRFMLSKEYETALQKAWNNGAAMIGHNRAATRGVVNDQNAHPFNVDDNIILVHNGTMRGNHRKHADVEVDSHAIAHLIHEKGDVSEALSAIDAAYALIWYDLAKAELNFIRNDERPLFWMELDDCWVWSSEVAMLNFVTDRMDLKVKTAPTLLSEHMLQKFLLQGKGWSTTSEKVEIKKPVYVSTHIGGGAGSGNYAGHTGWEEYDQWPGVFDDERPPFREAGMQRTRSAEEWADLRKEHTAAQRHRSQQHHPRHQQSGQQSVIQLLPAPKAADRIGDSARRLVDVREPVEFAVITDIERAMATKLNKIVSHGQYQHVIGAYPYNSAVHCQAFDYRYVNGKDASDGFYLYAHPFDDEDVIFRQFMSNKVVTEERMIQIAGCNYIYEFTMGVRTWSPINPGISLSKVDPHEAGFVIVRSTGAKLISSGVQESIPH